jgi:hypothetical protein
MFPEAVERPGDDLSTWPASPTPASGSARALRAPRRRLARARPGAAHCHHVGPDLGHLDGDGAMPWLAPVTTAMRSCKVSFVKAIARP